MGNKIQVIRGTTNVFEIPVTDADGNLYVLGENELLPKVRSVLQ